MVTITSNPDTANVFLDELSVGQTPVQVVLARSARGIVRLEKEGCETVQYKLPTNLNGTTLLNFLWVPAAPLGFLVDLATGNISSWHSRNVVTLRRK